jgi:hypothetical protein|tara:strand:- start:48 stop:437 length:390 start_codon:yes stop_codon:yes gene_type:complete
MPGYKPFKMKMKSYGQGKSPMDMGHAKAPNKFLGGLIGKAKEMGGRMLKGKDGKFGVGDAARLAMGPMGALAGGLFMKENVLPEVSVTANKKKVTGRKKIPTSLANRKKGLQGYEVTYSDGTKSKVLSK